MTSLAKGRSPDRHSKNSLSRITTGFAGETWPRRCNGTPSRSPTSVNSQPEIPAYRDAYQTAETGVPPPPSYPFRSQERRGEAEKLLHDLTAQGETWKESGPDLTTGAPRPLPQLQISPIY